MIDLHSHILPGIDDGARDLEASVAIGRAAVAGGVDQIVATPHVDVTYRNDPLTFTGRVREVQQALDAAGVPLRVHRGGEVASTMFNELTDEQLRACTLGDGDYLLLEPPLVGPAPFIDRMAQELQARGFRILIAHPERISAFRSNIAVVQKLVEQGCLTSVTAGSPGGQFGGQVKKFTAELFDRGLVHNLATDAHDPERRSPALRPTLERAVAEMPELEAHLPYLTEQVPRAILAGEALPGPPPVIEQRRGLLRRLGLR